ncbi:MAG: signal recognition particle-docking protein FtsY, partial [Betaproteobacteria bacterium]
MLPAQALHDDTQAFVAGATTIPNSASEAVKTQSAPASSGWFARLKGGLAKTRNQLADLFGVVKIDEQLLEDL